MTREAIAAKVREYADERELKFHCVGQCRFDDAEKHRDNADAAMKALLAEYDRLSAEVRRLTALTAKEG